MPSIFQQVWFSRLLWTAVGFLLGGIVVRLFIRGM